VFGSTQNSGRGKSGGNRNKIIKIGGSNTHISPRLEHSAWLIRCVLACGGVGRVVGAASAHNQTLVRVLRLRVTGLKISRLLPAPGPPSHVDLHVLMHL